MESLPSTNTYENFLATYGDNPHWLRRWRANDPEFRNDLEAALNSAQYGFREIVFRGSKQDDIPYLLKDMWKFGVNIKRHRAHIVNRMQLSQRLFLDTFGDEFDTFLKDAGFGPGRLKGVITLWRGGTGNPKILSAGRCWTLSYSMACSFALQSKIWQKAASEKRARAAHMPEPIVVSRNVKRADVAAFIGGPEREVILTKDALAIPAMQFGDIREWRRHRGRKQGLFC